MPSIKGTASIPSSHAIQKQLRSTTFPHNFSQKCNVAKVHRAVLTHWVEARVTQILGFEDDIVSSTAVHLFLPENIDEDGGAAADYWDVDPRKAQLDLAGFLGEGEAASFASDLWTMMLDAQSQPSGIPRALVEKKKEEMRRQREGQQWRTMAGAASSTPIQPRRVAGGDPEMNAFVREAARRAQAARAAIMAEGGGLESNADNAPRRQNNHPPAAAFAAGGGADNPPPADVAPAAAAVGPVAVPASPSPPREGGGNRDVLKYGDSERRRDSGGDKYYDHYRGGRNCYRGEGYSRNDKNWDRDYNGSCGGGDKWEGGDCYEERDYRNGDYYIDRRGGHLDEFGRGRRQGGGEGKSYKDENDDRKPPPRVKYGGDTKVKLKEQALREGGSARSRSFLRSPSGSRSGSRSMSSRSRSSCSRLHSHSLSSSSLRSLDGSRSSSPRRRGRSSSYSSLRSHSRSVSRSRSVSYSPQDDRSHSPDRGDGRKSHHNFNSRDDTRMNSSRSSSRSSNKGRGGRQGGGSERRGSDENPYQNTIGRRSQHERIERGGRGGRKRVGSFGDDNTGRRRHGRRDGVNDHERRSHVRY